VESLPTVGIRIIVWTPCSAIRVTLLRATTLSFLQPAVCSQPVQELCAACTRSARRADKYELSTDLVTLLHLALWCAAAMDDETQYTCSAGYQGKYHLSATDRSVCIHVRTLPIRKYFKVLHIVATEFIPKCNIIYELHNWRNLTL
jgi:hypothetical protein